MSVTGENSTAVNSTPTTEKKFKTGVKSGLPGNHGTSEVWTYFTKQLADGTEKYSGKADCVYCHATINAPSTGGTNKLWTHIKKCKEFPGFEDDTTQTIISFAKGQATPWRFDQEKCRKSLTRMIILCELPFSHVEKDGFRWFCEDLQPKFHVVCRTTITKDCLLMFFEEKQKLKEFFKVASTRICITTDMWTSIQNLGYIVLTAHFVDNDWKLHKKIINFRVLPHPHKGEAIAKSVESCLIEWGLEKVLTITLDNARNNDTCVVDLKKRLSKRNGLLLGGEVFHVRCFAHIINLVVRDGIEEVKTTIKRLRRSVKYVRSGSSRLQAFKKCVSNEMLTSKRVLCLDVKTRWNSTYLMINVALEFERAFDRLEEQDPNYKIECNVKGVGLLDENDWKKLKALHAFLEEFYELTKRVSGSKYVTSNTYFDELTQVKDLLMEHLVSNDPFFRDMALKMDAKFDKYCNFDSLNPILVIAIVLDPRYKMQFVEFWYSSYLDKICNLSEREKALKVDNYITRLNDLMSRLYCHYKLEGTSFVDVESSNISGNDMDVDKVSKRPKAKDLFRGILKRKDYVEVSNDLDRYLSDGVVVNEDHHFDILLWWHGKVGNYRALAMMARDVLCIPVTSVASESAFSTAGRVLDPFRSSLTPTTVECLVCTQDWLRGPTPSLVDYVVEEKLETLFELERVVFEDFQKLSLGSST